MKTFLVSVLLLATVCQLQAQDIQITRFERNYTNLAASTNPVYDNTGEACALIRFLVRDKDFTIEPNMGMMRQDHLKGEIRMYVPKGTKRLTVRKNGYMPLVGYEIPVTIEPKVTYDVELSITDEAVKRRKANKGHNVYVGAGYNILSISGPSVALGFDINHHNIELGAVFGLNKTDDMYLYDANSNVTGAYYYKAIRIQLRYGYDFRLTDFFSVTPQIGGAYNIYGGTEVVNGSTGYDSANTFSIFGAVRFVASFTDRFKMHITPEYDFGVAKNDKYKVLSDFDSKFKSWTDGFNLNIGLIYFF